MTYFFKAPPYIGPILFALIFVAINGVICLGVHLLFREKRTAVTLNFTHQMAMRIGTMHALVVALVFAALTSQLLSLHRVSDTEAISAANVYWTLKDVETPEAAELRELITKYLETVIEKDWEALTFSPHNLPAWEILAQMQSIITTWQPSELVNDKTIDYVFNHTNIIAEKRDQRIIERMSPNLPLVFWLIAVLGYFLTLIPYLSVAHSNLRFFLMMCFAFMFGLVFYGLVVLDNPFQSQIIQPTPFEITLHEIRTFK